MISVAGVDTSGPVSNPRRGACRRLILSCASFGSRGSITYISVADWLDACFSAQRDPDHRSRNRSDASRMADLLGRVPDVDVLSFARVGAGLGGLLQQSHSSGAQARVL